MEALVLQILKYAGFALAASAAIWGLIRKTTFEDPQGQKRLTPAGYVAIAFVLGSGLVSAGAFGVETVIKAQEKDAKTKKDEAATLAQERKDAAVLLDRALNRAEAAELRTAAANQRTLSLSIAGEERARQLAIARDVSRGAAANLAKADRALGEIGRLLQPAGAPQVRITWRLDGPIQLSGALKERLSWLAQQHDIDDKPPNFDWASLQGTSAWYRNGIYKLSGSQSSGIYPRYDFDPVLTNLVHQMNVRLVFFSPTLANDAVRWAGQGGLGRFDELYRKGDFSFSIPPAASSVEYELDYSEMNLITEGAADPATVIGYGALSAVQDFEKATLIMFMGGMSGSTGLERDQGLAIRNRLTPSHMSLRLGGRSYGFQAEDFRKIVTPDGQIAFVLDLIGPVRR